jgi:predicted nucleotidyltransferase
MKQRLEQWMQNSVARVMTCLAREPRRVWRVSEVAKSAGVSTGAASRRMTELAGLGVVSRPEGVRLGYHVNRSSPLLRQWKTLMTVWELRPLVQRLRPVTNKVVLFGSAAAGVDDDLSDIDLYIEADDPRVARELVDRAKLRRHVQVLAPDRDALVHLMRQPVWQSIHDGLILYDASTAPTGT